MRTRPTCVPGLVIGCRGFVMMKRQHGGLRPSVLNNFKGRGLGWPGTFVRGRACSVLILSVFANGCAGKRADILHFLPQHEHEVSAIEYRVSIPDVVAISAPRVLEIDGEQQPIRPDGKINLRLLGEVKVAGMTAKEIAAKLEVLLSRYYQDPKVNVRVTAYNSKSFYVYGQTGSAGPRPYTGRDTLVDAVVNSGTNFMSWTSKVKIIRPAHDDIPVRTVVVDVEHMLKTGDWSKNILLEPNDIVYIPPTPGAWIGNKLRGVLYPIAPMAQAYVAPAQIRDLDKAYDSDRSTTYYFSGGFPTGY